MFVDKQKIINNTFGASQGKIKPVEIDTKAFGVNCYQVFSLDDEVLNFISNNHGHYTYRTAPLSDKSKLHENGFYYCDTLVEPYATQAQAKFYENDDLSVCHDGPLEQALNLCKSAFVYDRFHRDPQIDNTLADKRYERWLIELFDMKQVYFLFYQNSFSGFIAYMNNKLVLHAMTDQFRGKGLAKYFWSKVCFEMFAGKHHEITSSVSVTNLAVVNLYASLGFKFRDPVDIYHLVSL